MTKTKKIELLYKKAKGLSIAASPEEIKELRKYKVEIGEGNFYTTKSNISNYITAVDKGTKISFYDWCMNNKKADRRRKGSSEKEMEWNNKQNNFATIFFGWFTWGVALYWMFQEVLSVGLCALLGAIISVFLFKRSRKNSFVTVFILPLLIASLFGSK